MSMLRTMLLALALVTLASAQQSISFPLKMVGESAPIFMAKAPERLCWLTVANSTRRVGGSRLTLWCPKDFVSWQSISVDTAARRVPAKLIFDNAPFENDVLAAVRYLKAQGAKTVSVIGGSFGGAAAGDASIKSPPGEIDRIVFLGAAPNLSAEKLKSQALFIVARR